MALLPRRIILMNANLFDPWAPDMTLVDDVTLCRTLSRIPRWCGQTLDFYSVAQHCCHVHDLVRTPRLRLPALLHDAHEALTGFGDIPSPIKQRCSLTEMLEMGVDRAIAKHYGFEYKDFFHEEIREADGKALATELNQLVPNNSEAKYPTLPEPQQEELIPWTMKDAEERMLAKLRAITTKLPSNIGISF